MSRLIGLLCMLAANCCIAQKLTSPMGEKFSGRVIASKLSNPWTIIYGPDNFLWITEGNSYQVSRIDPATGAQTILADLTSKRDFPR